MEVLDQYKANPDLRNKALKPLQDIKKQIQKESSIPGIYYQATMAAEALEKALEHVESAKVKAGDKTSAKPVRYIQPAKVAVKNYLETEADIEEFLEALKKELEGSPARTCAHPDPVGNEGS